MAKFRVTGGTPLVGSITISGRKNAALKLIAASLLSDQPITLKRVPAIGDVTVMLDILTDLGAIIEKVNDETYQIDTSGVNTSEIPALKAKKLRASLVLVGPLLARFGKVSFPHPGGDLIGKRSIAPHIDGFKLLGASVAFEDGAYLVSAKELTGADIYLKEKSVTGTENIIMAATLAKGITEIRNAAEEPHIVNLCNLLRGLGYKITGDGSSHITIIGSSELSHLSAEETIIPDDIEIGTFIIAAAITRGNVLLKEVGEKVHLLPILSKLDDFGVSYTYNDQDQSLEVKNNDQFKGVALQTNPWPGFPSDLQSPFTVLATQAVGTSLIHDWMYEGRLYFVDLLQRMGANIVICDPHRVIVNGPTKLNSSSLITPDIRAGAALILAALIAEGTSVIEHTEHIERGYVNIDQRLRSLGANITREE